MKNYSINDNTLGYIEGYYGRILSWDQRRLIVNSLKKNKMNTYLYAPKEDEKHRFIWRQRYNNEWRSHFRTFTEYCKNSKVNVIAGIAPGLDFNFNNLIHGNVRKKNSDFISLYNKAQQLLGDGASSIALLLDDIPENFRAKFGKKISEGTIHGILANKLSESLNQNIYFVPRIYADELSRNEPSYLKDLSIILNPEINVFYSGKYVVSKNLTNYKKIFKVLNNKIIFWDNYYANDYCPRRLFIGPHIGREKLKNIMINPTGLINTDLLILDLFANNLNNNHSNKEWLKTLNDHNVPIIFNKVKKFFLKPNFGANPILNSLQVKPTHIETLEFLLWRWKGELSREWYPFLFGLKQDLQLYQNSLTFERLVKTQTTPLSKYVNKI